MARVSETHSADYDATLAVLRRHTIGAYNGSQVACDAPECRVWMKTDEWHQHVAGLIAACVIPPGLPLHRTEAGWPRCSTCDGGGCPDCTDPA